MLPFSPGPVPTTDDELTDRLGRGLTALLRPAEPDGLRVSCTGSTAEHLGTIRIDLSGADVDPVAAQVPVAAGSPVTVDHLSLDADPVTVRGMPARARGQLHHLRVGWSAGDSGLLWLLPQEDALGAGAEGTVEVSARVADLEAALLSIGRRLLAERGFTLTRVDLAVEADGTSAAGVRVQAQVRRGILSATVDGHGRVSVDGSMVLTFSGLTVTSSNPLVSMGLAMLHRHLQDWEGRRLDLGTYLIGGLRVQEVSLRSDAGEVVVGARLGA